MQNFQDWDEDYYAQTDQAKEIIEILELFIKMTQRGQISQAPPNLTTVVRPDL